MKKFVLLLSLGAAVSCNNSKTDKPATDVPAQPMTITPATTTPATTTPAVSTFHMKVDGNELDLHGSILVTKDKDKLSPGNNLFAMITASGDKAKGSGNMTLNFVFDLKAGSYPVVGMGYSAGEGDNARLFGGLMGGKPQLTPFKVTLTECTDLGSNNLGGHKWRIAGSFSELVIPAMGIMLMDKTKNHPKEIKIDGGSFSNLVFDDNWEQLLQEGMKKFNEMKKKS